MLFGQVDVDCPMSSSKHKWTSVGRENKRKNKKTKSLVNFALISGQGIFFMFASRFNGWLMIIIVEPKKKKKEYGLTY